MKVTAKFLLLVVFMQGAAVSGEDDPYDAFYSNWIEHEGVEGLTVYWGDGAMTNGMYDGVRKLQERYFELSNAGVPADVGTSEGACTIVGTNKVMIMGAVTNLPVNVKNFLGLTNWVSETEQSLRMASNYFSSVYGKAGTNHLAKDFKRAEDWAYWSSGQVHQVQYAMGAATNSTIEATGSGSGESYGFLISGSAVGAGSDVTIELNPMKYPWVLSLFDLSKRLCLWVTVFSYFAWLVQDFTTCLRATYAVPGIMPGQQVGGTNASILTGKSAAAAVIFCVYALPAWFAIFLANDNWILTYLQVNPLTGWSIGANGPIAGEVGSFSAASAISFGLDMAFHLFPITAMFSLAVAYVIAHATMHEIFSAVATKIKFMG